MNKFLLIISTLIINIYSVSAYTHIEIPLRLADETGETGSFKTLIFGVDEKATDTWDSSLGERNFGRFPPPKNQFHVAFEIFDSINLHELTWSYIDYRPILSIRHYFVRYAIKVFRGIGNLLIFSWNTLPNEIDSAKITDRDSLYVYVDIDMKGTKRSDTITNKYMNEYYVDVWYNNPFAYIDDESERDSTEFSLFPVPADGNIVCLKSNSPGFTYYVYNSTGIEMLKGKSESNSRDLNISTLSAGLYFVVINSGNKKTVKKLVKI